MNKRYQVFISSTYADLKDERSKVIQTIMELDCIPAGMELFPAIDNEQFEFIKKVIDDCDYYILIIGGRYGSLSDNGLSYTEKEFNYALEKNIKVLAFLHQNPENIPLGKSETNETLRQKLNLFKEKVSTNRLIKFWNNAEELPGLVALSLSKTIKAYPAIGWIRANSIINPELYEELNDVRKQNSSLTNEISKLSERATQKINLAGLQESFKFSGTYRYYDSFAKHYYTNKWNIEISWEKLFALLSPKLLEHPIDSIAKIVISTILYDYYKNETSNSSGTPTIDDQDFQTLKIQFTALSLIEIKYTKNTAGGMGLYWFLTDLGSQLMMKLRTVKQ